METETKLVSSQLRHCCYDASSGGGRWSLIDKTVLPSAYEQAQNDVDRGELARQNKPGTFESVVLFTFRCVECGNIEQVRQPNLGDCPAYFGRIVNLLKSEASS